MVTKYRPKNFVASLKPNSGRSHRSLLDLLFGRPLSSDEERLELVGVAAGVAIFGLDALSSAAYGPEAALTLLATAGPAYIVPISLSIIVLLTIVYFSYRQTIAAYPGGGGSYTVASQNLGVKAGLLAAAALMIDYILDVAVGISAGVGALVSAVPQLQPHTLELCLVILLILTLINLRGLREAGAVFMAPTYVFVGCLMTVIAIGLAKTLLQGGHPVPVALLPKAAWPVKAVGAWVLLKAFASGCTAMTGVEAVSNGVRAFRQPTVPTARKTLTTIIATLIVLLAGIAYLVRVYGIVATPPGQPGYQSVLSMLTQAVAGRGLFYYVTIGSILVVTSLSANTAFADFPRLCHAIAEDGYLPYPLTLLGRRLVYTPGIVTLVILSGLLLIMFGGITDRLIPLFAVGAFLAFTLSQAGMVQHWRRTGGPGARFSMFVNGFGALATGSTACIVTAAKFTEGAWVTVLLIPAMILLMVSIRRHYDRIQQEIAIRHPLNVKAVQPPLVVVPIQYWSRVSEKALRFAYSLSPEVLHVVHVDWGDRDIHGLRDLWAEFVTKPVLRAGFPAPKLVVLDSPYRFVISPILDYILDLEQRHPERQIAVLVPELVERRWFYYLLHNQRSNILKLLLYLRGDKRIVVIDVPWYLRDGEEAKRTPHHQP
jgi:amino acid transporter